MWNCKAERLGGLEVDDELVPGRRLYRKIARLLASQNAIDVSGSAAVLLEKIESIRNQSASVDEVASIVDRRQFVLGRERDDYFLIGHRQSARRQDQTAIWGARKGRDSALDVLDGELGKRPFIAGDSYTVADISIFAYSHVAADAEFDLPARANLTEWIDRVRGQPGFKGEVVSYSADPYSTQKLPFAV